MIQGAKKRRGRKDERPMHLRTYEKVCSPNDSRNVVNDRRETIQLVNVSISTISSRKRVIV